MCLKCECAKCKKKKNLEKGLDVTFNFTLCESCDDKYSKKITKEITQFINKLLQPERLNPEDADNSVCDSLSSTNKERSREGSEEVLPPR